MKKTLLILAIMNTCIIAHADIGGMSSSQWEQSYKDAYLSGGVEAEIAQRQAYSDAFKTQNSHMYNNPAPTTVEDIQNSSGTFLQGVYTEQTHYQQATTPAGVDLSTNFSSGPSSNVSNQDKRSDTYVMTKQELRNNLKNYMTKSWIQTFQENQTRGVGAEEEAMQAYANAYNANNGNDKNITTMATLEDVKSIYSTSMNVSNNNFVGIGGMTSSQWEQSYKDAYLKGGVEAEIAQRQAYSDAFKKQNSHMYNNPAPTTVGNIQNSNGTYVQGVYTEQTHYQQATTPAGVDLSTNFSSGPGNMPKFQSEQVTPW